MVGWTASVGSCALSISNRTLQVRSIAHTICSPRSCGGPRRRSTVVVYGRPSGGKKREWVGTRGKESMPEVGKHHFSYFYSHEAVVRVTRSTTNNSHPVLSLFFLLIQKSLVLEIKEEEASAVVSAGLLVSEPGKDFEGDDVPLDDLVLIGQITGAHGVKGHVKVRPLTDEGERRFGEPGPRFLGPDPQTLGAKLRRPSEVVLESGRKILLKGLEAWIIRLEGVKTREEADGLAGHVLYIHVDDREEIEEDGAFYVQELLGLEVFLPNAQDPETVGELVGTIVDVHDGTGTYDCLRIRRKESDEQGEMITSLIPFAKDIVPYVDLEDGVVLITPPEGLLDITTRGAWQRDVRKGGGARADDKSKSRKGGRSKKRDKAAADREAKMQPQNGDIDGNAT